LSSRSLELLANTLTASISPTWRNHCSSGLSARRAQIGVIDRAVNARKCWPKRRLVGEGDHGSGVGLLLQTIYTTRISGMGDISASHAVFFSDASPRPTRGWSLWDRL
jgi:hypothetical protein